MPPGRFREAAVTVTVTGAVCGCTYTFADLRATETVGGLKRQIQAKCGMPRFQQRLLLGARALDDDVILASLEPPLHLSLVVVPYKEDEETSESVVYAIWTNNIGDLERALRLPANPNGPPTRPADQESPLYAATSHGSPAMVQLLIDALADPNIGCNYHGAQLLIDALRDPNIGCNYHGTQTTCLHVAALYGSANLVRALCVGKADVGSFDQHGRSPMDLAIDEGNEEAVLELRAAGAAWDVSWQAALRRAVRSKRRNLDLPVYFDQTSGSDSERISPRGDEA